MGKTKLTEGDLRFIDEALNPWKMRIDIALGGKEPSPEVSARISEYEEMYKKDFREYYEKAKEEDPGKTSDDIQYDFEEEWYIEHPEFFDIDKLVG